MKKSIITLLAAGVISAGFVSSTYGACCKCNGATGRWAIQKQGAFWLGVCNKDGKPSAKLLWGGGSPVDQYDIKIDGATATMKQRAGKDRYRLTTVKAAGDEAEITFQFYNGKNEPQGKAEVVKAKRIAATAPTQIIDARPTSARMSKTRRPSRWTAERAGSRTGGSRTIIEG